jgi:hypothetical protein
MGDDEPALETEINSSNNVLKSDPIGDLKGTSRNIAVQNRVRVGLTKLKNQYEEEKIGTVAKPENINETRRGIKQNKPANEEEH